MLSSYCHHAMMHMGLPLLALYFFDKNTIDKITCRYFLIPITTFYSTICRSLSVKCLIIRKSRWSTVPPQEPEQWEHNQLRF